MKKKPTDCDYTASNYVHPEAVVERCKVCKMRIRGKNHELGTHHQSKANGPKGYGGQ